MPTMDAPHPVSETSATEAVMIARVHKDLAAQLGPSTVSDDLLIYLATTEVHALWSRPVKTFIPLLALRAALQRLETLYGGETVATTVAIAWTPARGAHHVRGIDMAGDVMDLRDDVMTVE